MTLIRNNFLWQISDSLNQISNGVYPVSRRQSAYDEISSRIQTTLAGRLMG